MKLQRCSRNRNENLRKLNVIECNLGGCYMLVSVYYVGLLMCVGFTRLSSFNVECQGHALSMWSVRCYLDTQNTCTISNVKCQVLLFGHTNMTPYFTRLSSFNVECQGHVLSMWSVRCYLDTQNTDTPSNVKCFVSCICNVKCQVLLFGHTTTTPYFTSYKLQ
jgi:hypothetical protein